MHTHTHTFTPFPPPSYGCSVLYSMDVKQLTAETASKKDLVTQSERHSTNYWPSN
ncbi:hypothetical protein EXN66_Car017830 [Channa argus]|uniref:Uncharacterized protein n=1 Tax=Channa argus TaxID=215402 RepID=A0A6G1QHW0_CHAAH|nr:hypothetical protein EXN66_Car017830 [Channa argus]